MKERQVNSGVGPGEKRKRRRVCLPEGEVEGGECSVMEKRSPCEQLGGEIGSRGRGGSLGELL